MTDLSPETVGRHGRLAMRVRELADDPDMQIEPAERARILHIAMDVLEDYIVTARASLPAQQRRDPCGICGVVECDGNCATPPDDPRADEGLDDEAPCTTCYDSGITIQTERVCSCEAGDQYRRKSAAVDEGLVEAMARALADDDCSGLRRMGINADIKHWRIFESAARAALTAARSHGGM